ncbi:MAG: NADPH:quinone oxidoreductase family protein, partial [Phenylobacterium sp.]
MKALLSKVVGGPESLVLEDVPSPEAKPGHAVISVKAIGVNFPDVLIIEDKYQFKPERPFAPGGERSGVVKSVGEGVTNVKPGDRILANTGWGAMAEEVLLPASRLWKIPDAMPYDVAAAFILTYGTSYHALKDRGHLKAGETLLVLGAAGGVGLSAVELGKAMGARVIAACSTQEKVDLAI